MKSFPAGVNSIIFDLGGVLVDLSTEKTAQAFAALAGISVHDVLQAYASNPDFTQYEKGEISNAEFRNSVRRIFSVEVSDSTIDACWNAMLLGLPEAKLTLLNKLKKQFSTLLLSNTNAIHLTYIEEVILVGRALDNFFTKAYYSHKVGMRKPDVAIYSYVLEQHNIIPEQTVFLDDSKENLEAANSIGIRTIHITHPDEVFDIFKTL